MLDRRAAEGVGVVPVTRHDLRPPPRTGLLLGYGSLTDEEIREGIRRLAAALRIGASG